MDTSNIINLGLLLVTAIGVFVAIYQAKEARAARTDAESARDAAGDHESAALAAAQASAEAAGRQAAAIEEQTEFMRANQPSGPLTLTRQTKSKWELRNNGQALLVRVTVEGSDDITPYGELPTNLRPGQSIYLDYSRSLASPATTDITISWDLPGDPERQIMHRTLS